MRLSRARSAKRACARLSLALALLASAAHAETKLVIWMVGDDTVTQLLTPAVQAFKLGHPGAALEVELRDVPWADAMSKYSASLASRIGPDLGAKGALIDLNQRAPDLVKLLTHYAVPSALRSVRRPDGVMHAAPFDRHLQLQFYRTDLLANAPSTCDEFDAAVRQLQASSARGYAQQWGNTNWLGFFPDLLQSGDALNHHASVYREIKASTDTWPDADGSLESGATPSIQSGIWQLSALDITRRKIIGRWAAAPLAVGPTGRNTTFFGSSSTTVFTSSTWAAPRPRPGF